MSAKSDYRNAVHAFDAALTAAMAAHETLRATFAACGGVEGATNHVPDLLFKPLITGMAAAWRKRVSDAEAFFTE